MNSGANPQALRPGQHFLWTVATAELDGQPKASGLETVLSGDEHEEARRFRFAREQRQFIEARALLRLALSRHHLVPAAAWRFGRDRHGKPFLLAPAPVAPVRFSVSHTPGLVACLTTLSAEAAVDVEFIEHRHDLALVAAHVLSAAEQRSLGKLAGAEWTRRFFEYWTLKEAYAKARGLGLDLAFRAIEFDLAPHGADKVFFSSPADDSPSAWTFRRLDLLPRHAIAVAVKKDPGDACEINHRPVKFDGAAIVSDE